MHAPIARTAILAAALALVSTVGMAPATLHAAGEFGMLVQRDLMRDPGFLRHHPDMKFQARGVQAWERGDEREAYQNFLSAARYGNKLTQAMVAEMLWTGQGIAQDRPRAYAWMDLAAERGYPSLLGIRERYWKELGEEERERAIEIGKEVYAEYGDDVAKPRLEAKLRRGQKGSTGSRLGAMSSMVKVYTDVDYSPMRTSNMGQLTQGTASRQPEFYSDRYWVPEQYWAWQDGRHRQVPYGVVSVLPLRKEEGRE